MMDILKIGQDWLEEARDAHMATAVTYTHAGTATTLNATEGRCEYEASSGESVSITAEMVDWIVIVADLATLPEPGDVITSNGRDYEVMRLGSEGCFRYRPGRTAMRIHTKAIS